MEVVGRAGYKLRDAIKALKVDLRGKTVLDIGSSTGGFTECALRCGAAHVIAVEKGTNQMKVPLRFDKRVELYEKMDVFDFHCMPPDVILADVSFVSLRKVLTYAAKELADNNTEYLVMLKPQFEARKDQLKDGVVKNSRMRRAILAEFEEWLKKNGFVVKGKRDNELAGRFGNVERFYYLRGGKNKK